MTLDNAGNIFVVLEAENKIIYCNPLNCNSQTAVNTNPTPQGVAYWNGFLYWSEYGAFWDLNAIAFGAIRKSSFPGGVKW